MTRMRAVDAIAQILVKEGATEAFGLPGAAINPLYDALRKNGGIRHTLARRAIAREAGVGVATLYRHFPTREALVEAIYHDQLERLTTGARELLAQAPAPLALRSWMDLFGEWVAAKSGMLDTLRAMIETGRIAHARTRTELLEAIETILAAGRGTGELRSDVSAEDVAAGLIGIFSVARQDDASRGARLLDVFADGLRAPAASPSADERLR